MALTALLRQVLCVSRSRLTSPSLNLVRPISVNLQKNPRFMSLRRMTTAMEKQKDCRENVSASTGGRSILTPPLCQGMTILDKKSFDKDVSIPTITLEQERAHTVYSLLKPYFLKKMKFDPVQICEEESVKIAYLNPDVVGSESDLEELFQNLKTKSKDPSIFKSNQMKVVRFTFDNWTLDEIFESILPEGLRLRGYSKIGHIIHLNLKDYMLPYKKIIGEVLLVKVPSVKSVLNKVDIINSTYRNFEMEVLAGISETLVQVKQNYCSFDFDFAKVYWNPRLSTEHERIYGRLNKGDTLYDVFAGVGPFALPAGKKQVRVFANDLNPESFKWLQHNIKKNKLDKCVRAFNMDGREFITKIIKKDLEEQIESNEATLPTFHITMNLPSMAVDFLDSFWNLLERKTTDGLKVIVHVYCFVKGDENLKEEALALVKEKLDFDIQSSHLDEIDYVRTVATNKDMFRVSFRLPIEILT